jgi:hypothetical protein
MKPYARWIVVVAGVAAIVVLFVTLRPGGDAGDPAAPPSPAATGPSRGSPTPTDRLESPPASPAAPAVERIEVTVSGGDVRVSPSAPEVSQGSDVEIVVHSDVADEVHVHGYDLMRDVDAGGTATIDFTANAPGVFEVELEDAGELLFELTVTP